VLVERHANEYGATDSFAFENAIQAGNILRIADFVTFARSAPRFNQKADLKGGGQKKREREKRKVMKKSITQILVTAGLSLMAASMAMAATDNQKLPAQAPDPSTIEVKSGNGGGVSAAAGSNLSATSTLSSAWSVGWNYVHLSNCYLFYSGGYPYLYMYPKEGGYFYTTNTVFQQLIAPACQTGNWIAFYVYDSSNDWSAVWTYDYK